MEFDPADQQYALEQAESELLEAEQEIVKRRAEILVQESSDKVTLLTAQYDVRRAALDANWDKDLIAENDYKIRQAELTEAKRNLTKLEQDVASRRVTSKASLAVLQERKSTRRDQRHARADEHEQSDSEGADGWRRLRSGEHGWSACSSAGMGAPLYRPGDTVFSGRPVVDVFDLSTHGSSRACERAGTGERLGGPDGHDRIRRPDERSPHGQSVFHLRARPARPALRSAPPVRRHPRAARSGSAAETRLDRSSAGGGRDGRRTSCCCPGRHCSRSTANRTCI